jgi:photosystem II stability/assembly factor-like uncharacterized protein
MYRLLLLTSLLSACTATDVASKDTGNTEDDSGGGGNTAVVWDDHRYPTSSTFTGVYTDGSSLWVTSSDGTTWTRQGDEWLNLPIDSDEEEMNGIWGSGSGASLKMVTVGAAGLIAEWSGETWDIEASGTAIFHAVDGPSVTELIAVGGGGPWDNLGGDWLARQVDGDRLALNDVWFDGTIAVAVGDDGVIAHFDRDSNEWTTDKIDSKLNLYGVSGTNSSDIWAVGEQGLVLHWDGTEWIEISLGTRTNMWSVWSPSGNLAYVVGANGSAYKIQGNIVTELPTGVDQHLYAVTGTNEVNVWAVGSKGLALHLDSE